MKQITIKDVALAAGVSYSTVSRSLNDSPLIPQKTKIHVKEVAEKMGFVFNANARSLITRKSLCVAIVIPEHFESINVNLYHSRLINKIRENLEEFGYDLLLVYQSKSKTHENNVCRLISQNKIDGLLFLSEYPEEETMNFLEATRFPCVFVHYPPSGRVGDFDCIYPDNALGGRCAADYLISKGYTSFLFLASSERHLEFEIRMRGFLDCVRSAGLNAEVLKTQTDFFRARELVAENSSFLKKGTALVAINDLVALGAMQALESLGFAVPRDIAVVGYDDSEFCEFSRPQLTTIHQPREDIAFLASQCLIAQIREESDRKPIVRAVPPILVVREST